MVGENNKLIASSIQVVEQDLNQQKTYKQYNRSNIVFPGECNSLPEIWPWISDAYGSCIAVEDYCHSVDTRLTYKQLYKNILDFAAGLQNIGLKLGDKVALFSENSSRWLIADQGIMLNGAVNAVRGPQASMNELLYIIDHSESSVLIVENIKLYKLLLPNLQDKNIKFTVVLWPDEKENFSYQTHRDVFTFEEILQIGKINEFNHCEINKDDLATLIYTSGTTGKPKGAMITHGNLLHQVNNFSDAIPLKSGHKLLSILPTWHVYERACEYYVLFKGINIIYSCPKTYKQDLIKSKPQLLIVVPRLLELIYEGFQHKVNSGSVFKKKLVSFFFSVSKKFIEAKRILNNHSLKNIKPSSFDYIAAGLTASILYYFHKLGDVIVYNKVRKAFGGEFIAAISGGGELSMDLEDFYEIVNMEIRVGYGLTETSPVISVRSPERGIRGSVGQPIPHTLVKIVDQDTFKPLPKGQKGIVMVKGPQVMKGYYRDEVSTRAVLNEKGWLNTGDLGWMTDEDDIILTGRAKDVIVLSNGENVEPLPIENACLKSQYIKQIMVVGQDKNLAALIVPDEEALSGFEHEEEKIRLFRQEINELIHKNSDYRPHERITGFKIIYEPFSIENGLLTQTYKLKRNKILEKYYNNKL